MKFIAASLVNDDPVGRSLTGGGVDTVQ